MQQAAQLRGGTRPCVGGRASRRALQVQAAASIDLSCRIRGSQAAVYLFVSDFKARERWWQGLSNVKVTRDPGRGAVALRSQYQVNQSLSGFNVSTLYEVVDLQPGRKVVYTVGSDMHHATEQILLIQDPHDPDYTVVRYLAQVELTAWRKSFTPMLSGVLRQIPQQGVKRMGELLNGPDSPLPALELQVEPLEGTRAAGNKPWSFNNIFTGLRPEGRAASPPRGRPAPRARSTSPFSFLPSLEELAGSVRGRSRSPSVPVPAAPAPTLKVVPPNSDALGYYSVLGLDGTRPRTVTEKAIKSAYRRAVQLSHPDKFSTADEDDRVGAEETFKKVQRAYEVLKEPERRRLYDQGKLGELEALQQAVPQGA